MDNQGTTAMGNKQQAADALDVDVSLHAVIAHKSGLPQQATVKGRKVTLTPPLSEDQNRVHLTKMIENIKATAPMRDGKKQIVIYIHGGMNTKTGAVLHTHDLAGNRALRKEYYPISIDWNSAPLSTYLEHLLFVRRGSRHVVEGTLTSPVLLTTDLARGVARAPVVWSRLLMSAGEQPGWVGLNYPPRRALAAQEALKETRRWRGTGPLVSDMTVPEGDVRWTRQDMPVAERIAKFQSIHNLFFAPKMATGLLIDVIGTGAWDMMLRRSELLFRSQTMRDDLSPRGRAQVDLVTNHVKNKTNRTPEGEAAIHQAVAEMNADPMGAVRHGADYLNRSRPGAVEQFLSELEKQLDVDRYSITLVGHSMGAIVSNEILKRHSKLPFDHIVYMAAACSVTECADNVGGYMRRNPDAKFYNLSLHPISEVGESNPSFPADEVTTKKMLLGGLGLFVPRGSLLVWLDEFFTKPVTLQGRRMGMWRTAVTEVNLFPKEVQKRVHLKMFPAGDLNVPQKHGAFTSKAMKFWEEGFRTPEKYTSPPR